MIKGWEWPAGRAIVKFFKYWRDEPGEMAEAMFGTSIAWIIVTSFTCILPAILVNNHHHVARGSFAFWMFITAGSVPAVCAASWIVIIAGCLLFGIGCLLWEGIKLSPGLIPRKRMS